MNDVAVIQVLRVELLTLLQIKLQVETTHMHVMSQAQAFSCRLSSECMQLCILYCGVGDRTMAIIMEYRYE